MGETYYHITHPYTTPPRANENNSFQIMVIMVYRRPSERRNLKNKTGGEQPLSFV